MPDVIVDPKNCVPPGSPGYCSPGGGQCLMAGPGGTVEDCTADLPETPAHAWYCTLPCSKPGDCTGGASCRPTGSGSRCVPKSCDDTVPEAGPEGGGDAPVDTGVIASDSGSPDAAVDAPSDALTDAPKDAARDRHD